ncbi:MAG: hypothetical protein LUC41_08130 [Clostridiales bacterium]|nr:hypothetical protein [Clostridiales bacterium]
MSARGSSYNYNYSRSSTGRSAAGRSSYSSMSRSNYDRSSMRNTGRRNYDHSSSDRSGSGRNTAYVDGNTVRRIQEVPAGQPRQKAKSFDEVRRSHAKKAAVRRNMERALVLNRRYVVFLTLATVVCLVACVWFINLQSEISSRMSSIAAMETTVSETKAANDILESRVETGMTLDEVKDRAEDLGLVYPSTSQIEYFSVESDDYMNQYADVASN